MSNTPLRKPLLFEDIFHDYIKILRHATLFWCLPYSKYNFSYANITSFSLYHQLVCRYHYRFMGDMPSYIKPSFTPFTFFILFFFFRKLIDIQPSFRRFFYIKNRVCRWIIPICITNIT